MKRKILMTLATLLAIAQGAWAEGELTGKFTVNASGKQVCFSQGNLRATYNGSAWSWAFATNQWDYIGNGSGNISINGNGTVSENGTVDLFGWVGASSSWTDVAMYGISKSTANNAENGYGTGATEALKSDWGNVDGISSGWRTPTSAEWGYIFSTRTTGGTVGETDQARYTMATIRTDVSGGVNGVIIFPDGVNFAATEFTTLGTVNDPSKYATKCTSAQWSALAIKGAVFLPAAGYRYISEVNSAGSQDYSQGYYWSSSPYTSNVEHAYSMYFASDNLVPQTNRDRYRGFSVRLVKDVTVYFAAGSGGEGWNISPATPYEGQTVTVSYTGVHKVKSVTVKGKSVVTAAPTPNVLTYTGSAQALVSAGTATCGNLVYSLTSGSGYSTSIPTATNAGNYTVYYKVDGGSGYTGTPEQSVNVTIAKAAATLSLDNTATISFTSSQASGTVYSTSPQATFTGGTLTATSANTDNCTVDVNQISRTIIVTRVNNAAFSDTQITVSVTPDDNHTAPSSVTFNVSAEVYSKTFNYDGEHSQTFIAPAAGWYTLEAYGAQGGNHITNDGTNYGGLGGKATIRYHLNANQTLYIYVGEQGHSNSGTTGGDGGWNGGGKGGNGCKWNDTYYNGVGGGGGASYIATSEIGSITSGTNLNINGTYPVSYLLLVAGGGGGAGHVGSTAGKGGGITGEAGQNKNGEIEALSWHNGNHSYGQDGNDGFGADGSAEGSGGGGGGFIGGSANQNTSDTNQDYGGSGGRSWGNVSDPAKSAGYSTTTGGATEGGNGKVVITYYGTTYPVSGN